MCKKIWRSLALLTAACMASQAGLVSGDIFSPSETSAAEMVFQNAEAASTGTAKDAAIIRGENASVVKDSDNGTNVLDLKGGAFGASWLQLPDLFKGGCKDGFSIAMKFNLHTGTEDYTRLYQFATLPFGTGVTPSYSSPDLSVDLNKHDQYRCSVFAGKGSSTENDNKHRAIFNVDAKPDSDKWHDLCVTYSADSMNFYLDGKEVDKVDAEYLTETLGSLFGDGLIESYKYNSIGHSLYNDNDIKAKVDDVAFYDYALSASEVKSLTKDAKYLYTFEDDTLKEGEVNADAETSVTFDGVQLQSVPELQTVSPDGTLTTKLWTDNRGSWYYSVHKKSGGVTGTVIEPSKLGLVTTTEDLSNGLSLQASSVTDCDETYTMPYGKHTTIRNHYNEITIPFKKGDSVLTVIFRVYDDGIGFRYALNHGATIKDETSQVVFPTNGTLWGNGPNATYEWNFTEFGMDKVNSAWADYSLPLTGNFNNKYWVLVSEANVFNESDPYCAGCLSTSGGSRAIKWKFGVKTKSVTMNNAFHTPWRAMVVADNLNDMSSSDLILNLNPPSVLEDESWIKPGKTAWSWWSSGGDSPVEYHTQKDYVDFAAANGWDFVCLDFGWALWDDSEAKVREICEYADKKGIGIYLWYGVNNSGHSGYKDSKGNPAYPYYSLLDEATIKREFERISGLGVKGVKVDYYESDTKETMKQMYLCMDIAAKNKLMVLFHGCTLPRGESRTYPNVVSYEAVNGAEYYKWFDSPSLENRITYTFTRNVVGSADFTPTGLPIMDIKATAGFALADIVNIESGIVHYAHSVFRYPGTTALALINDVPLAWDDLKILDGRPMQFNVTARRSGEDWYIGASTIKSRDIEINLGDLITDDDTYKAYIFSDNSDGSDLKVTVLDDLTKTSTIKQSLLNYGGCVIKITKTGMKLTTPYSEYKFYEAEQAKLSGSAKTETGKNGRYSSGFQYVGYIGKGGAVTFDNVEAAEAGDYTLYIYYISGEYRDLDVTVNGGQTTTLKGLYANRNDWTGLAGASTTVKLNAGKNSIKLGNDRGNGPSIDRIAIVKKGGENASDEIIGDVNLDGTVNVSDYAAMVKIMLSTGQFSKQQKLAADINGDGTVNIIDLLSLKKILA